MTALDVISLNSAKDYLVMTGIDDRDAEITRLIKTAISLVEKYTDYALYERETTISLTGCSKEIATYPIAIDSVKRDTADLSYTTCQKVLSIVVNCSDWRGGLITATIGYTSIPEDKEPLVDAAYKIITYLFENKDIYTAVLPLDIQLMLNEYRRSATI